MIWWTVQWFSYLSLQVWKVQCYPDAAQILLLSVRVWVWGSSCLWSSLHVLRCTPWTEPERRVHGHKFTGTVQSAFLTPLVLLQEIKETLPSVPKHYTLQCAVGVRKMACQESKQATASMLLPLPCKFAWRTCLCRWHKTLPRILDLIFGDSNSVHKFTHRGLSFCCSSVSLFTTFLYLPGNSQLSHINLVPNHAPEIHATRKCKAVHIRNIKQWVCRTRGRSRGYPFCMRLEFFVSPAPVRTSCTTLWSLKVSLITVPFQIYVILSN